VAALALVDAQGEFTIGEVAAALAVRPSSIYNHVTGKADIVEAMRALIFAAGPPVAVSPRSTDPPVPPGAAGTADTPPDGWQDALRTLLRRYRDAFGRHPKLIPMLTAHTVSSPDVVHMYDDIATVLTAAGIPAEQLLDVMTVLDSFVIGSALGIAAPDQIWDPAHARTPALIAAIAAGGRGRARADRAFELGLDVVLGALTGLRIPAGPPAHSR